ncbi:MAG: cold shock domain-containing protein, partial [Planctomycetota bacterium]
NDKKGYGFITGEGGRDVFVHRTDIVMEGYKTLREGQDVTFEIQSGEKGPRAVTVKPTDQLSPSA